MAAAWGRSDKGQHRLDRHFPDDTRSDANVLTFGPFCNPYPVQTAADASGSPNGVEGRSIRRRSKSKFSVALVDSPVGSAESGFRKAYIGRFVERVEVDYNEIRIRGSYAALAQGLTARSAEAGGQVPSFGQDWWAKQDSNRGVCGFH